MAPIRFVFGLHLHQPVGNFDHVFSQHLDDVYRPLLEQLGEREFFPVVLHLSGPLLEWLEEHEPAYLDRLGRLAARRASSSCCSPASTSRCSPRCRARIGSSRSAGCATRSRRRFGVEARGLWLTERVWEPELAADLADAGVDARWWTTGTFS